MQTLSFLQEPPGGRPWSTRRCSLSAASAAGPQAATAGLGASRQVQADRARLPIPICDHSNSLHRFEPPFFL